MADHFYNVPNVSDKSLVSGFKKAFRFLVDTEKFALNEISLQVHIPASHNVLSVNNIEEVDKILGPISGSGRHQITSFLLRFPNYSAIYTRHVNNQLFSHLKITIAGQLKIDLEETYKLNEILQKSLLINKVGEVPTSNSVIESHSNILSEIESLSVKVQEDTADFRNRLEEDFLNKRAKLDEDFLEKAKRLESEYDKKKQELDEKEKKLDNRANTHARRDIRKQLNQSIKERIGNFSTSKETEKLRFPIHLAFILLISISGVGVIYFSNEFVSLLNNLESKGSNLAIILAILKPLGLTVLFSTGFIMYIKWLNNWFVQRSTEESSLRKYQLDVDRSSWIVETVLESVGQHKKELPKELILSFTENLFVDGTKNNKKDILEHPADHLASALFGTASKLKVKTGNSEIEFDRKGLKSMKELEGSSDSTS